MGTWAYDYDTNYDLGNALRFTPVDELDTFAELDRLDTLYSTGAEVNSAYREIGLRTRTSKKHSA